MCHSEGKMYDERGRFMKTDLDARLLSDAYKFETSNDECMIHVAGSSWTAISLQKMECLCKI
jgi:hypothetical protein